MKLAQGIERRSGKMPLRAMSRLHQLREQDAGDVKTSACSRGREHQRQLRQAREQGRVESEFGSQACWLLGGEGDDARLGFPVCRG
jgi:hypothetical protein